MNTKLDHLIGCVAEEAGEVGQAVGKVIRFGLTDKYPEKGASNLHKLIVEVHDLIASYQMLMREVGVSDQIDPELIKTKEYKIAHYMDYARKIGQLKEDS